MKDKMPKPRIIKSLNGRGEKCKQYFYDYGDILMIHKYTLIKEVENYKTLIGGDRFIKTTEKYGISFHWFVIKKETLLKGFDL